MPDETLRGSCLCGTVRYRVEAPFRRFVHCHCLRCRKATGSAHASNLVVAPEHFAWLAGEDSVARFDLASARSFATCFCRSCGTPVPHFTRSGSDVIVPAGSLDDAPSLAPQGRIFWGSRAKWSCSGDDLPRFDEYPQA